MSQVITKKEKGDNLVQNIINSFYYSIKEKR